MLLKVCGLKEVQNINEIIDLDPHFIGHIYYSKSPRNIALNDIEWHRFTSKRVLVTVNLALETLIDVVQKYKIQWVQLHGDEDENYCKELSKFCKILKAIPILSANDFEKTKDYKSIEYFIFDTKTNEKGGSGKKFNWSLLKNYQNNVPFFLSGGIDLYDSKEIVSLSHPSFVGIDINSKFELSPANKDVKKIKQFLSELNNEQLSSK